MIQRPQPYIRQGIWHSGTMKVTKGNVPQNVDTYLTLGEANKAKEGAAIAAPK